MGLFLLFAPLAGGGILAGFAVPIALSAMLVWALALWAARQRSEAYQLSPVVLLLFALAAIALLRGSPFGGWMAAELTRQGWSLWPGLPQTGAIAPGGAASGAARLIGMALICDAASMRFGTTTGFRQLLVATSGAGLLAMLVGVFHESLGATALYGNYKFPAASHFVPLAAPFSNPNVAGSLAALAAMASWGLAALRQDGTAVRAAFVTAGIALVLHALRLEAHGALAATAAALFAGSVAWFVARSLRGDRAAIAMASLPVVAALCCSLLMATGAAAVAVGGGQASFASKIAFWRQGYGHLGEAGLFGFGPGSFHDLGARFLPVGGGYRPAFVESEPAQFVFDHGLLAAALALAVGIWLFATTVRRFCAASQRGYAAAFATLTVWMVCDAILGMAWESLPFAMLLLALGASAVRTAQPMPEGEGLRLRGWFVGGVAVLLLLLVSPSLSSSMKLGQERGRNPFAGTERKRTDADGAWKDRVQAEAVLAPVAPIVLVEEGRRALAKGDGKRGAQIAGWLKAAAPMDESALAFRINEAEHRKSAVEVCDLTRDYLMANNAYLVRPRFWTRLGPEVSRWIGCLPTDSDAEQAAISYLRREKRYDDALALTIGLMARSPKHLPTLDVGFAIAMSLRRYDSAEIFLQQRRAVSGESAQSARMGLSLRAARGETAGLAEGLEAAIVAYPEEASLRLLRLSVMRDLGRRGLAPEGAVALVEADGRELRLAAAGAPTEIARCALAVGQALLALQQFDAAAQQLELAREEAAFRPQAEQSLAEWKKARAAVHNAPAPFRPIPPK